jgi:hypothetical protein
VISENEFILQSYWDFHAGTIPEQQWQEECAKTKSAANLTLAKLKTG